MITFLVFAIVFLAITSLKIVKEYERGVKFTLGKFSGIMGSGLNFVIPVFQTWQKIDMRTTAIDVPDQECITKDNVSVRVNAVLYYRVIDADKAVIKVEDFIYAISQLAQTTMRDVVGEVSLDELLSKRETISEKIKRIVDKASDAWGIKVLTVDLKHIELPENMKRTMAKEAEAERERRAVIIKAEGDLVASGNISKAAKILGSADGAIHLRTLQTLNDISSDQTNTIKFFIPLEVINSIETKAGGWTK